MYVCIYIYMYIYYIYIYIYEIGKTRLYQTTKHTSFFILFTCYVYLRFRSLTLLVHKYIAHLVHNFYISTPCYIIWYYLAQLQAHISIHIYQILLHDDKVKITKLYERLESLLYIQQYWFISKTCFYQILAYNGTVKPDLSNTYETHIQVCI